MDVDGLCRRHPVIDDLKKDVRRNFKKIGSSQERRGRKRGGRRSEERWRHLQ
jgi:hypothetical protein